jgi:hypothetical protein
MRRALRLPRRQYASLAFLDAGGQLAHAFSASQARSKPSADCLRRANRPRNPLRRRGSKPLPLPPDVSGGSPADALDVEENEVVSPVQPVHGARLKPRPFERVGHARSRVAVAPQQLPPGEGAVPDDDTFYEVVLRSVHDIRDAVKTRARDRVLLLVVEPAPKPDCLRELEFLGPRQVDGAVLSPGENRDEPRTCIRVETSLREARGGRPARSDRVSAPRPHGQGRQDDDRRSPTRSVPRKPARSHAGSPEGGSWASR